MTESYSEHNDREKLWELIKGVRFTMISHQTETQEVHSQPMTMLNFEGMNENQNLYFIMKDTKDIVQAITTGRHHLGLSFAKPSDDTYVSISAHGEISTDRALIEKLWNPWAENWFDGKDDPSIRVLVAKAFSAEYWNITDNKVTHLLKVLKGNVTGKPEKPDAEHAKINL